MTRPDSNALDIQHVPLAARLFPPLPYSRGAFRLAGTITVSYSVSGARWNREGRGGVGQSRQMHLLVRGRFLCSQKTGGPPPLLHRREEI